MPLTNFHTLEVDSSLPVVGMKELAPGIMARIGKKPDGKTAIRSILFDKTKFTPEQVKAWGEKHGMGSSVSPAKKTAMRMEYSEKRGILFRDSKEQKVWGVVAAPGNIDSDGYIISKEAIRQTAHRYMEHYREVKYRHGNFNAETDSSIIESCVMPGDVTIQRGDGKAEVIKEGSWFVGTHIRDKKSWQEVENDELAGYSLGGFIIGDMTDTELEVEVENGQD